MSAELFTTSLYNDANLASYYRFNTGALTTDTKGAKTLTNNNTVGEAAGKFGIAADFGATNSNKYFSRADGLGIDLSADKTLIFWIKLSAEIGSSYWRPIDWRSTTGTGRWVIIDYEYNAGTRRLVVNNGSGTSATANVTLGTSLWHQIVVTTSGTTITLYIDGASAATGTKGTSANVANSFWLGCQEAAGGGFVSGLIDDVSMFTRALTLDEIKTLYSEQSSAFFMFM